VHLNEEISEIVTVVKKVRSSFLHYSSVYKGSFVLEIFAGKEACQSKWQWIKVSGSGWPAFDRNGSNMKPAERFDDDNRSQWSLKCSYILKETWLLTISLIKFSFQTFSVFCAPFW